MRALIVATVLLLGACVTQLQVVGPYANRLSRDDVHQIKLVVSTRRASITAFESLKQFVPIEFMSKADT